MLVGTGGLTLFPGTPLLEEAQRGEFDLLTEKDLTGPDFLKRKESIIAVLEHEIEHGDPDAMAMIRNRKRTL